MSYALGHQTALFLQGLQPPLVAHGLLQHETKLSVLNFAIKKDANFSETLKNKTELLFVTGLRWTSLLCPYYYCSAVVNHKPLLSA